MVVLLFDLPVRYLAGVALGEVVKGDFGERFTYFVGYDVDGVCLQAVK